MVPEIGHFSLILALVFSFALQCLPLLGAQINNSMLMAAGRSLSAGFFVFVVVAFGCLTYAFLVDDFSVSYVANHSTSVLPASYKGSAVWGGPEGSLLLWVVMLAGWPLAIALLSGGLPGSCRPGCWPLWALFPSAFYCLFCSRRTRLPAC